MIRRFTLQLVHRPDGDPFDPDTHIPDGWRSKMKCRYCLNRLRVVDRVSHMSIDGPITLKVEARCGGCKLNFQLEGTLDLIETPSVHITPRHWAFIPPQE